MARSNFVSRVKIHRASAHAFLCAAFFYDHSMPSEHNDTRIQDVCRQD
jgi:hypothetical protein